MPVTAILVATALLLLYIPQPIESASSDDLGDAASGQLLEGEACSNDYECSTYACCDDFCEATACVFDSQCDDSNPCTINECSAKIVDVLGYCEAIVRFPDLSKTEELSYQCVGDPPNCEFIDDGDVSLYCPTTQLTCGCPEGFLVREEANNCFVDNSLTGSLKCQPYEDSCGNTVNHYDNNCNIGENAAGGSCICCLDEDGDGVCDDPGLETGDVCGAECLNSNSPDRTACSKAGASGYCSAGTCVVSDFVSLPSRFMWVMNETGVSE